MFKNNFLAINVFISYKQKREREKEKEKEKERENHKIIVNNLNAKKNKLKKLLDAKKNNNANQDDIFYYDENKPITLTEEELAIYGDRYMRGYNLGDGVIFSNLSRIRFRRFFKID